MNEPDTTSAITLTEGQSRSLTVGVRRLWQMLDQLEQLLSAPAAHDGFTVIEPDIDRGQAQALRCEIDAIRAELRGLARLVEATPEHRSARAAFEALASSAWTIAEDIHPRRLGRYGHVDLDAAAALAPITERLAARLLALAQQVNRPSTPRQ